MRSSPPLGRRLRPDEGPGRDLPTAEDQERIAAPLADLVKEALAQSRATNDQKEEARQRLLQLAELFPSSAVIAPVSEELTKQAQTLFEAAKGRNEPDAPRQAAERGRGGVAGAAGLRDYAPG